MENSSQNLKTKIIVNLLFDRIRLFFLRPYWKDRLILTILVLSFLINAALWIFLKVFIKSGPVPLTLHYTIYFGPDLLGEAWQVFTIPLAGFVIILINIVLGFLIYPRDRTTSYFLVGILPIIQVFLWVGGVTLVMINS